MPGEGGKLYPNGNYSRKHKTSEAHIEAQQEKSARWLEQIKFHEEMLAARAERTPQEQLNVLDERLGTGRGAKKERARLKLMIGDRNAKRADRKRRREARTQTTR